MKKNYLLTPGPTPIPPSVLLSMAGPIIHHRTTAFEGIFAEVREGLKRLFQTKEEVLTLCSSGTGAMESAVCNLLSPDDSAIVVSGGKFGQRWEQLCQAYGVTPFTSEVEWGKAVVPATIEDMLKANPQTKAVFTTISETSTGVLSDIKTIAQIVAKTTAVLVVDAITGLGVMNIPMDEWGVDVLVTGSQKALMMPPGLGFIALSQKAWKLTETAKCQRYYFDLRKELKNQLKNQTSYTPAITLIIGLRESLRMIHDEGLSQVVRRHEIMAEATRAAITAMGLELFPESPSPALTTVKVPDGIDGGKLVKHLVKKYGVTFAGGQEHLKGKIFRIAHLGYMSTFDVIIAISALEMVLCDLHYSVNMGQGVAVAQGILAKLG